MATFTNQATLSYSGGTVSSNVATGEILEVLTVTKTAITETYVPGQDVSYAIQLTSGGETDLTDLTLTDDLGATPFGETTLIPLTYVPNSVKLFINGVLQPTPAVTVDEGLTVSGITVPAGGVATVLYTVTVNDFAPPEAGGTITNTAVVTGAVAEVSATATITAVAAPRLSMLKSVSPTAVAENGRLTFTFLIENAGSSPADATDNAVITDTFDPLLTDLSVMLNGQPLTAPDGYVYDAVTGVFTTVAGVITVPAADFQQDPVTGLWSSTPGSSTLTVTGTI